MPANKSNTPRPVSAIDANSARSGSHPLTIENSNPLSCTSPEAHEQSPVVPLPAKSLGVQLLEAIWRSPDRSHQIGTLNRYTTTFKNLPVNGVADAVAQ